MKNFNNPNLITYNRYDNDRQYFDTLSKWLTNGYFKARIDNLISLIQPPGPAILDVGCGVGTFAIETARMGYKVIALDFSRTALNYCQKNAEIYYVDGSIHKVQSPVEFLPFKSNLFDTIFAADIIEHIYNPKSFLHELYRVLKPNGKIIFETPNIDFMSFPGHGLLINNLLNRIHKLPDSKNKLTNEHLEYIDTYHINNYSIKRFKSELNEAGLIPTYLDTAGWWLEIRGYDLLIYKLFAKLQKFHIFINTIMRFKNTDIIAVATKQ